MLQIDFSLLIQVGNFLLLIFLLNIFLYRPIRRIIAQRSEEMGSLEHAIRDYQGKADEDEKDIQEHIVQARREGFEARESLKMEGFEKEKGILQDSTSTVEERISGARSEIGEQIQGVRKILDEQVALFSKELAEKILGRNVS
jgi:F-type H+-transporting ATPase subunit b